MKVLTLHTTKLEVHEQDGHVFVVPKKPSGYVIFFRGGTGEYGKLTLSYVFSKLMPFVDMTGLAILAPDYGQNDQHGGEADLLSCDTALKTFPRIKKYAIEGAGAFHAVAQKPGFFTNAILNCVISLWLYGAQFLIIRHGF